MKRSAYILMTFILAATLLSCAAASRQDKGTAVGAGAGAGIGAILGQAIGRSTEATVIGAAIGAMAGGIAGNQVGAYMDRQEQDLRNALAAAEATGIQRTNDALASSQAASVQRTKDVLTATFRSEVLFEFDSSTLKPGAYVELSRVAAVLNKYPDTAIAVEGHTDAKGSEVYNQRLSERRAQAVKNALVQMGVSPHRIQAVGYGESQPVSSKDAMNRRVNIVIQHVVAQG